MALKAKPRGSVGRAIDYVSESKPMRRIDKALKLDRVWTMPFVDKAATKYLPWKGTFLCGNAPVFVGSLIAPPVGMALATAAQYKRWRAKRPIYPNLRAIGRKG